MTAEESERNPLPFEPNKKRQKPAKATNKPVIKAKEPSQKTQQQRRYSKQEMAIPFASASPLQLCELLPPS